MLQVSLDTSFLISFADPTRPGHTAAVDYFRHCLQQQIPMWISVVAAGEFEVGQPITDLPLQNFRIQPYNLPHAIRAASLFKVLRGTTAQEEGRKIVMNDLKIIAQAAEDEIGIVLTEDENTLARLAARLRTAGSIQTEVVLLKDGFSARRLGDPRQMPLSLNPDEA